MKRYQINVYVPNDSKFPVNTYVTGSSETASICVARLLTNSNSGLSRIEILDTRQTLPLLVMSPQDLD
jgi:hypothetical protein